MTSHGAPSQVARSLSTRCAVGRPFILSSRNFVISNRLYESKGRELRVFSKHFGRPKSQSAQRGITLTSSATVVQLELRAQKKKQKPERKDPAFALVEVERLDHHFALEPSSKAQHRRAKQ